VTAARLAWKLNRFEILFLLALSVLLGVSAWVLADQIRSIGLTEGACWPQTEDGEWATRACDALMESFWPLASQAGMVRAGLAIAPSLLGLLVGVPIVARELETRTAVLSWSLAPTRWRWLLTRFLPMLAVAVVVLGAVAWAGTTLYDALWLGREGPDLAEVAALGVALVARGLAALGVATLVGALVGRTLPAFVVGVVVLVVWALVLVPQTQNVLAGQRSAWQREDEDRSRYGERMLTYTDYAFFDPTRPGLPAEPGLRIDPEAAWAATDAEVEAACGPIPDDDTGESPEYRAWSDCAAPIFRESERQMTQATKVVPRSAWGDFVALDVVMSLVLGTGAILLTFPVVSRRKPG
jgi:hypothetical protein